MLSCPAASTGTALIKAGLPKYGGGAIQLITDNGFNALDADVWQLVQALYLGRQYSLTRAIAHTC